MARPLKEGLLYFSFDTDFFYADSKIKILRSRYGSDGLIFYIYLLTEIYRNGYYVRWNGDSVDNAMVDLGLTEGLIEQIMTFLVSRSLLNKSTLANSDTIITSPGIQKRYQEAVKSLRRSVYVDSEIWLLSEEETAACIKVTPDNGKSGKNNSNSSKNNSKSEINPIKEIKGNKRKEIYKENSGLDFERAWNNTVDRYPKKRREATAKQIWMNRLLAVGEDERAQLATDIYNAIALFLTEHIKNNSKDEKYEYVPKFDEWLTEDCDYWLRRLSEERAKE